MNVSISLLIIFGTVFLVGEHVLARTLETGRAGGYYTHSGKGDRSARARFERFKSRKTPTTRTSITPISVSDQYGNRYRGDLITSTYDPSAKARAGAAAWDKRQSAKAKTIINQAEHEAQSKITREEEAQVFRASLVGSEMCIRDSSGSRKTGKGGQGSCRQDGKGFVPARQTGNNE